MILQLDIFNVVCAKTMALSQLTTQDLDWLNKWLNFGVELFNDIIYMNNSLFDKTSGTALHV